ncbi:MAG: glycosyl transferase group 1 [Phycisphaerales bacterium]|nr:glycosyl transferase group 1 [Phycisphaerales bacterium]
MNTPATKLRVAYMTGEYPRATDTFIQREVAALRAGGTHVQTFSVRKPHNKENVGPETQAELERTYYVFPPRAGKILAAHAKVFAASPGRYLRAVKTALTVRPAGLKALVWQAAYFVEAGVVAREVKRQDLSHLHNHFSNSSCSVAMLAAEMGGFTFSFTMHGPMEFFEPKYWRLDEKIRRALFVACISHFCRSQGMIFGPQDKWARMHVVHCGVDPALFEPARHEGVGHRLLFVGRLAGVKGLPVLLDAVAAVAKIHPDVRLTLAGDGPDRARLTAQAERLGIASNVVFLGYRSQAQVRELLREADVFVMGSFAEGVPVVLMEAMAAGVPVVATQVAGIPELVEAGVNGMLVPPGDPAALATAVAALVADPELRLQFGRRGREKVLAEFDIHAEAARLGAVLTAALQGEVLPIRPAVPGDATGCPAERTAPRVAPTQRALSA